jgi:uncharacterized membrane protein YkoI
MLAKFLFFVVLLFALAALAGPSRADQTVAFSDIPPAVQKTIQAQVAGGKMDGITKYAEDLDTVYDVDLTAKNGLKRDFTVAQDGTLLSVEVTLAETPAAVRETIKTVLNGSGPDSIDKNLDDAGISYDIEGPGDDGKAIDFTVDDDGTVSSREVTLDEIPDAVQKTIVAQLNGGKVKTIDENFDDVGTNFDVTITTADGSETGFNVAADGTVISKELLLNEVPVRARATIQNRIDDGTILRIDKSFVRRNNVLPFEVEGRKDGKPFDFSVAPRGRFLGMDD